MKLPEKAIKRLNLVAENYIITEEIFYILEPLTKKEITEEDISFVLLDLADINDDISSYVTSAILTVLNSDNLSDKEQ